MLLVSHCGWQTSYYYALRLFPVGVIVLTPSPSRDSSGLTQSWQGSATKTALCPTVSDIKFLTRAGPV